MPFFRTEDCKRPKKNPIQKITTTKRCGFLSQFAFLEVDDALDYCCFFRPLSIFF